MPPVPMAGGHSILARCDIPYVVMAGGNRVVPFGSLALLGVNPGFVGITCL
jgi:hypothetical protein